MSAPGFSQPPCAADCKASRPALAIGRIGKHKIELTHCSRRSKSGRIPAEQLGATVQRQGFHIIADEAARFSAFIDKQTEFRATRQRLDYKRASAGKEIKTRAPSISNPSHG